MLIRVFGIGGFKNFQTMLDDKTFFTIYLPALEEALNNDEPSEPFYLKKPLDYVAGAYVDEADRFEEINYEKYAEFFNEIAVYFDAKEHGLDYYYSEEMSLAKSRIYASIQKLKTAFGI